MINLFDDGAKGFKSLAEIRQNPLSYCMISFLARPGGIKHVLKNLIDVFPLPKIPDFFFKILLEWGKATTYENMYSLCKKWEKSAQQYIEEHPSVIFGVREFSGKEDTVTYKEEILVQKAFYIIFYEQI